jgi:antitoxin component YwqK of YwqJK toxin-antitoxin module
VIRDNNLITRFELYYDEGKEVGVWKQYDENGVLIATREH